MIEAYKAGIPFNGKPVPDGARMAKIHWTAKKDESQPGDPLVPGPLHDIDFMVKVSKRFADSGGWGYAQFDYDVASETFRPADESSPHRRSTTPNGRVRLPHDTSRQGLRFHGLPDTVNRGLKAVGLTSRIHPAARARQAKRCICQERLTLLRHAEKSPPKRAMGGRFDLCVERRVPRLRKTGQGRTGPSSYSAIQSCCTGERTERGVFRELA